MKFDLQSLKDQNLPVATREGLGIDIAIHTKSPELHEAAEKTRAEKFAIINNYLKNFTYQEGKCPGCGNKCPGCGNKLGGFLGTFRWGLAHGEGGCSECGYPCRGHHRIDDEISFEHFVLPYHPNVLQIKAPS